MIDKTLVKKIFKTNKYNRERANFKKLEEILTPKMLLKQYYTIIINLGRQLGHSTNFIDYIRDFKTIYIVNKIEDYTNDFNLNIQNVFTIKHICKLSTRLNSSETLEYVLVDPSCILSLKDKEYLYDTLVIYKKKPIIIFIG